MKLLKLASCLILFLATVAHADLQIGTPAPDFYLDDAQGKNVSLSKNRGRYVVLEWVNYDCPFVRYHYHSQNMQNLQKEFTHKGVVWLSINSSAPGKQGYLSQSTAHAKQLESGSHATALLLDPDGKVAKQYGAKTTPHIFIINPEGKLIYQGALDKRAVPFGQPFTETENYVRQALTQAMAGKPVSDSHTKPYGCSIKF